MIEISGVPPEAVDNLRVNCAKVGDVVTGTANLANWTVKVDGATVPRVIVSLYNGFLKVSAVNGTYILFR